MEALQKEGGGGDNLAVGWAKPGESTSAPSEVIPGSVCSPPFTGPISREVWTGIGGTTVASIPVGRRRISLTRCRASAPTNWADNYGTRLRGYITAPVSGNYIFWIASDDNSERAFRRTIAPPRRRESPLSQTGRTRGSGISFRAKSPPSNPLVAEQCYYVEALQKEAGGGDNLAGGVGSRANRPPRRAR